MWSRFGYVVQVLTRASPKARLSALQRSCAARASGVSPPHWRWASAMVVSGVAAPRGVAIKFCTYCTISLGSTRTVRFGCGSLVIVALPKIVTPSLWGASLGNPVPAYGKLHGMNDDLVLLVLAAGVLAGGYKIWQTSLDAREAANRIAKDT